MQRWRPTLLFSWRRYLTAMALGNLGWEVAHAPLYTMWLTEDRAGVAYAIVHCTIGDVMIAAGTLGLAIALVGRGWPVDRFGAVVVATIVLALGYTVFSEWLNVSVRGSWAYRDLMPTLPILGTGLTPLLQWIVVPALGFWWSRASLMP